MSKRRINKQQGRRIEKRQADYRDSDTDNNSQQQDGLVITRFSRHAEVETQNGDRIRCAIRSNMDSLVAGDRVIWQPSEYQRGVIISRYPRTSVLDRSDKRRDNRPVAANITQLIIVIATKPAPTWSLLDSYLVMAENLRLQVIIVLNKVDLACDDIKTELIDTYHSQGYPLLLTSQHQLNGYDSLQKALSGHISVFVGQSGVGKSSLIAGILPHETNIQTAEISTQSELGCHTTSNSRLYHLPTGGALIDSPGIREFGLWQMPLADITYGFREFRHLTSECKFRNCNHKDSPGCAIVHAVSNGQLSYRRYDSMLKIHTQLAENSLPHS